MGLPGGASIPLWCGQFYDPDGEIALLIDLELQHRWEDLENSSRTNRQTRRMTMQSNVLLKERWGLVMLLLLSMEPMRCGVPMTNAVAAQFPPTIIITEGKTSQGFPYLFGGISTDEREAMEERAKGYNVKLIFAEKRGAFVSGVTVTIANAKGAEIAALKTEGPWFYIQLPPGDYSIKARCRGEIKQIKNLTVPKDKRVQQGLAWDLGEQ